MTQSIIRAVSSTAIGPEMPIELVTVAELDKFAQHSSNRKAPGPDMISSRIIKAIWPAIVDVLVILYNDCITHGIFPDNWKNGDLTIIPKGHTMDPTSPKAYRPITLLPELGKLFERVIRDRLYQALPAERHHERQFGFVPGKSAHQVVSLILESVNQTEDKYAILLCTDISGAFDNMWWPALIQRLSDLNIPGKLINCIKSYLQNRHVKLYSRQHQSCKTLNKGCPQESVLAPTLWNLIVDELLEQPLPEGCGSLAYADDISFVISANSRVQLETRATGALKILLKWAEANKLQISTAKSNFIFLKGRLDRSPIIKLNGKSLNRKETLVYLGVTLDSALTFVPHVKRVTTNASTILMRLKRSICQRVPDIQKPLRQIYLGAVVPILSYAIEAWGSQLHHSHVRRLLLSAHAASCRIILVCYHSVSGDAVAVLAGLPPLDLILEERYSVHKLKTMDSISYGNVQITRADFQSLRSLKNELRRITEQIWQDRWSTSEKGSVTKAFLPIVHSQPIYATKLTYQVLTGHGNFIAHLHRCGKSITDLCSTCHMKDDPLHRIFDCPDFEEDRLNLAGALPAWPLRPQDLLPALQQVNAFPDLLQPFAGLPM